LVAVTDSELPYWLILSKLPGIGYQSLQRLLTQAEKLSDWFNGEQPRRALQQCLGFKIQPKTWSWAEVEQELSWHAQPNQTIVPLTDANYPYPLATIASPPLLLYVKGQLAALATPQLAIVGARQASTQGCRHAFYFAKALSAQAWSITSGLALGIDQAAHQGALADSGVTLAVLGSGVENIYPRAHQALAARIQTTGALISEYPLHCQAQRAYFPQRNRIIAGLSAGVVVVEAARHSGSLISARCALEENREVFALPGPIDAPLSQGCHDLIRQGAKCVDHIEQIVEEVTAWPRQTTVCNNQPVPELA